MELGRSSNPALNKNTFSGSFASAGENVMTLRGTVNKSFLLLLFVFLGAAITWRMFFSMTDPETGMAKVIPWMAVGGILGFIASLVTIFKRSWSPVTAPLYAFFEGLFLGSTSAFFEYQYPGIVMQAVALTFGTLLALLFAYRTGLIKATENFKLGVFAATGAVALIYLLSFIFSLFGINFGYLHDNGWIGIGISLFIVVIAALNLVMDFDFIENGANSGAPKYMEWYAAFGLMVTLIWLYIEFLRLLAKLNSRK